MQYATSMIPGKLYGVLHPRLLRLRTVGCFIGSGRSGAGMAEGAASAATAAAGGFSGPDRGSSQTVPLIIGFGDMT